MPTGQTAQNGWPALRTTSPLLHTWVIPARTGEVRVKLRSGSAGFILAHFALWFAERVEPLHGRILDDWGYAYRDVVGMSNGVISNHAAGCAVDLNATTHPYGVAGTFSPQHVQRIQARLRWMQVLRWGGNYVHSKDEMHFEIVQPLDVCERRARFLTKTPRGLRLLKANPGQRAVIYS